MKKTTILKYTFVLFLGILISSCKNDSSNYPETDLSKESLIPKPSTITATKSSFILDKNTPITTNSDSEFIAVGSFLSKKINSKLDFELKIAADTNPSKGIIINKVDDEIFGDEGYELIVSCDN